MLADDRSHKARMFVYSNAHMLLTWLALNIVARYECVYNHNSIKNYKDKHKKSNSWEKIGEKFNSIFSNPKPMFPSVLKLTLSSLYD